MDNPFNIDFDINIYSDCQNKIRFHHSRSYESPDKFFLHINEFCEMYVFVEGDAKYLIEDKYYNLQYGDIIIIQPNEMHRALLSNDCVYERYFVLIPTNAFSYFKDNTPSPIDCFINRPFGKNNIVHLDEKSREEFFACLRSIDEIAVNSNQLSPDYLAYSHLLKILHILNENFRKEERYDKEAEVKNHPKFLSEILNYIHYNISDINTANDIAKHFYVSLPYISTYFTTHMKTNLSAYIRMKKVAKAKLLLSEGKSVTEACFESGFNNCSYFIKIFKKIVGITPLEYKSKE